MVRVPAFCIPGLFVLGSTIASLCPSAGADTRPVIVRKPVLAVNIGGKDVDHVNGVTVEFEPRQRTGVHEHPIPVIGYVIRGEIEFQEEGQQARTLHAGEAFYEPANKKILRFDNASTVESAQIVGFYLMSRDDKQVIHMLE
jgi:hypothetical protein